MAMFWVVCSTKNPVIGVPPKRYDIESTNRDLAIAAAVAQYQTYTWEWTLNHKPLPPERIAIEVLPTYQDEGPKK